MPQYEASFYIEANIIGYTGTIGQNPTVYFQNGNKFGRITQDHNNADNIGRNKVREYADYTIGNTGSNGNAEEFYNGRVRHTSRNSYVAVTDQTRSSLADAITNFPNVKPKYNTP